MTDKEIATVLGIIKTAYPRFYMNITKDEALNVMLVWKEMFADVPLEILTTAVKSLISHFKYPPSIADIREEIAKIVMPDHQMTADEAWGEAHKAVKSFGYYKEAEALATLKPIVADLVRRMGYKDLCMSENVMADRAHFIKLFDNLKERERKETLIPLATRERILQIQENVKTGNVFSIGELLRIEEGKNES